MQVSKFLKKNILIQKSQSLYARLHCVFFSGPCGGKTTGQSRLCTFFENLGWKASYCFFSLYVLDIQYTYCSSSLHTILGLIIKRNFLYILGGITFYKI